MIQLYNGDCLEVIKQFSDNIIDTIITDPPYGLEFMGKDWDRGVPGIRFWKEFLRVCKPGAFALVFGGTRTYHRLACAIEDAGWEIRDCMMWLYGSGFPKSHSIGKAIDKLKGNEREYKGITKGRGSNSGEGRYNWNNPNDIVDRRYYEKTQGQSEWEGYGTTLKPAWEPIIVAMKPLDGTFANNAEKYGVAGLWIDGGRISTKEETRRSVGGFAAKSEIYSNNEKYKINTLETNPPNQGRWPANLILDEEAGKMLDEQSGSGASRFFYCAKSSKRERGEGCTHPTVKPLALMEYLCKLTKTPTGGIVLDPFAGSGTTGLACKNTDRDCILIEKEQEYCDIITKRVL